MRTESGLMNTGRSRRRWIVAGLCLLVAGTVALWLWRANTRGNLAGRPVPTPNFETSPAAGIAAGGALALRPGDLLITLPPDKLANAQLKLAAAVALPAAAVSTGGLRTTGTVQSNAYKETPVLPLAGGSVREVNVLLGDHVERGQKLGTLFSTELAEAQTAYLSMQAEIEKHHKHFHRATELVELGALSREEYEDTAAAYKTEQAKLAAARQRLLWLGTSAKQIDELRAPDQMNALLIISAPSAGTVLNRNVNPGEVVTMGKELFRLADLTTVWVIGQVYEQDLAAVRVGTPAAITAPAYPQRPFTGRVAYIDPRVEAQTRTAQVRIELSNPGQLLKLGMFVDLSFGGRPPVATAQAAVSVPRAAVQLIGAKQVVFVETAQTGVFAQREVQAGPETNDVIPIYAGLRAGERVVTEGSFLLRAESLKLNSTQTQATPTPLATMTGPTPLPPANSPGKTQVQTVTVELNEHGYRPASFSLRAGVPARLTFVRKVEATCGTEVVLPDYGIKRELPLNQPVVIEFTPAKAGEFKFACGMDMLRGKLVVH